MTKNNSLIPKKRLDDLYKSIVNILQEARAKTYKAVNFHMVEAYWNIGRVIIEDEQDGQNRAEYGKALIEELSVRLRKKFGKGFNERNLWYMKKIYQVFPILHALRAELSWTHYRLILKVEKEDVRQFYIEECVANNWSTRQLERQINSFYHQRLLASKNKNLIRQEAQTTEPGPKPEDIIKDPYVLEFLSIKGNTDYTESQLEQSIIEKLQDFLLELGKGFSFVARQKRISTPEGKHFYIDLTGISRTIRKSLSTDQKSHAQCDQLNWRHFRRLYAISVLSIINEEYTTQKCIV